MPSLSSRECIKDKKCVPAVIKSGTVASINSSVEDRAKFRIILSENQEENDSNNEKPVRILEIVLPSFAKLPVDEGDNIVLKIYDKDLPDENMHSFVLENSEKKKLLISNTNMAVPEEELPEGISVLPSDEKIYVETGRFQDYCMSSVIHSAMTIETANGNSQLVPGEYGFFFDKHGQEYTIIATDSAKIDRSDCKEQNHSLFNYIILFNE
jgi:hypothetical protein